MATPNKRVISADVESQWYQALFEEDCIVVMQLLENHPSLLKVGWESEPSRWVEGRMRREEEGRTHSRWKGRTALHVAASRGCVKLIMKVLSRCKLDGFSDVYAAYEQTLLPSVLDQLSAAPHPNMEGKGPSAVAEEKDPSAVAEEKDPVAAAAAEQNVPPVVAEKKGPVTARPSLEPPSGREASVETPLGDSEIAESEAPLRGDSPDDNTNPQSDPPKGEDGSKEARTGDAASKGLPGKLHETVSAMMSRLAEEKKKGNARQSAARIERQRLKKESNQDAISRDYVSDIDRRRLLIAKDGEIGLDALAIAILHGKEEVIILLRYCIGDKFEIQTHYYKIKIDSSEATSMFDEIATRNMEKRKLLRKITVAAAMIYIEKEKEEKDAAESVDTDNEDAAASVETDSEDGTESENIDEEDDDAQIAIDRAAFDEYLKGHDSLTPFSLDEVIGHEVFKAYFEHRDFNFLPPEEYLFHFLCSGDPLYSTLVQQPDESWVEFGLVNTLWMAARSWSGDDNLWRFLLQELTDGQGRTPFHIAMEDSNDYYISDIIFSSDTTEGKKDIVVAMTAPDEAGRTPVQKAAAAGRYGELENLIELARKYECDEVAATYHESWTCNTEDWGSSWAHGFALMFPLPQTPLHAALINKNFSCAELLLNDWFNRKRPHMTYRSSDEVMYSPRNPAPWSQRARDITDVKTWMKDEIRGMEGVKEWIEWDLLELSIVVGAPLTFIEKLTKKRPDQNAADGKADIITSNTQLRQPAMLQGDLATPSPYFKRKEERGRDTTVVVEHNWHPLHLAASFGNYDLVKYLISDLKWDPFFEDSEGNSVLHYATKGREFELPTHLLDYVSVEHYSLSTHNRTSTAEEATLQIAERQGCINFLLQIGCDVFKTNNDNQVAYPTGSLKDDKFLSWWYGKQEKEFTAAQSNLNFATNAIAVTATLVATASYVGPLQPPLGYDSNHIQYTNGWVSTFIVCDTLSFYLAIVAITLSLIPSLPMPQQAMMEELHRTREMVIMAIGILLPSIFFVFIAFACSSISVMSDNITSQGGGILVIISTLLGAVLCLLAFTLFFIRLLAFIFPKNKPIRYLYDLTFVTKYFKDFSKVSSWFHEKKYNCKALRTKRSIPTVQKQESPAGVFQNGNAKL